MYFMCMAYAYAFLVVRLFILVGFASVIISVEI